MIEHAKPAQNGGANTETGDFSYADTATGEIDPVTGDSIEVAPAEESTGTMTPPESGFEQDEFSQAVQRNEAKGMKLAIVFLGIALLLAGGIFVLVKKKKQ